VGLAALPVHQHITGCVPPRCVYTCVGLLRRYSACIERPRKQSYFHRPGQTCFSGRFLMSVLDTWGRILSKSWRPLSALEVRGGDEKGRRREPSLPASSSIMSPGTSKVVSMRVDFAVSDYPWANGVQTSSSAGLPAPCWRCPLCEIEIMAFRDEDDDQHDGPNQPNSNLLEA